MGVLRIIGPSPLGHLVGRSDKPAAPVLREGPEGWVTPVDAGKPPTKAPDESTRAAEAAKIYQTNLSKLIPGEALALFALGKNVSVPQSHADFHAWPLFCLVATIIFRLISTKSPGRWPQFGAVLVSALSFVLWIYAQDDWFFRWRVPPDYRFYIAYVMLFWVFVVPAVFEGEKPTQPAPPHGHGGAGHPGR